MGKEEGMDSAPSLAYGDALFILTWQRGGLQRGRKGGAEDATGIPSAAGQRLVFVCTAE